MTKNDKKQNGFTLIEIFIVVTIIAILASISMGLFFSYRQKAYNVLTLADVDSFKKAQMLYQMENESYQGNLGDTVGNDGAPSTFLVSGYNPGPGIRINVISAPDPFIIEAVHIKSNTVIEYNFATNVILKR